MAGGSNPQNVQAPNAGGPRPGNNIADQPYRPPTIGMPPRPGKNIADEPYRQPTIGMPPRPGNNIADQPYRQPSAPSTGQPNVFQQSSNAYTQALQGTTAAGAYQPQNVRAGTAAGGINTYMNPYTQQVIDTSMADLERQRQMQQNQLGAQASAAGAFGGSRQGIAEAETNRAFAEQGGQLAAQLRQQGFQTALGASQQDVANRMQAALANQGAGLQAANLGLNAASQLGNLSQQGFNMGQAINQQQQQFGTMQQAINQALIDAARGQYAGFTGAPGQSLGAMLGALGGANMGQQTSTQTQQPGLFNYLSLGLGAL